MNTAIILAAGSGTRLGGTTPKQFQIVEGRPLVSYTIEAFDSHPAIDRVAVVTRADSLELMQQIVREGRFSKVTDLLCGGSERHLSTLAALQRFADDAPDDIYLLHDGVRPMVSHEVISRCIGSMRQGSASVAAVAVTDTIACTDDRGHIVSIPQRRSLRANQTPQTFRAATIRKAFSNALADPSFIPTDDVSVVLKYLPDTPVLTVEGDRANIKVTYAEDIEKLAALIRQRRHTNTE